LPEDILYQADILGLDLAEYYNSKQLIIERMFESRSQKADHVTKYGFKLEGLDIELPSLLDFISDDTDIVIIDNIGVLILGLSIQDFKNQFDALNYVFSKRGCTPMFIMDDVAYGMTNQVADYSVFSLIKLLVKENPYTGKLERYMSIPKIRSTNIAPDLMVFDIMSRGIRFRRPHLE
jgi:KaiC/GvpD/RAD55 family RecA-like ATPase